jgi:hypothetical protein
MSILHERLEPLTTGEAVSLPAPVLLLFSCRHRNQKINRYHLSEKESRSTNIRNSGESFVAAENHQS